MPESDIQILYDQYKDKISPKDLTFKLVNNLSAIDILSQRQDISATLRQQFMDIASTPTPDSTDDIKALQRAVENGQKSDVIELLKKGMDVHQRLENKDTLLHLAVKNGRSEVVRLLIDDYKLDPMVTDQEGNNALHLAARDGHSELARRLINHYHLDLESTNTKGHTALHLAACNKYGEVARVLIEQGAQLSKLNPEGETPLAILFEKLPESDIQALYDQHKDKINPQDLTLKSVNNLSAIYILSQRQDISATLCQRFMDIARTPTPDAHQECTVCWDKKKDTAYLCGHVFCGECSSKVNTCPTCREPITARIRIYY